MTSRSRRNLLQTKAVTSFIGLIQSRCGGLHLPLLFASTLFLSSALLFLIQPMYARMVLPHLGGTPAVWNTCQVFFQATLLLGYLYAHQLPNWLGSRRHLILHLLLLLIPFIVLPIAIPADLAPPADRNP